MFLITSDLTQWSFLLLSRDIFPHHLQYSVLHFLPAPLTRDTLSCTFHIVVASHNNSVAGGAERQRKHISFNPEAGVLHCTLLIC